MSFVLPDAEIKLIQRWVEQGAVEGNPADLPPPPKFVEGWRLGEPDLILTATKPLTLPPQGTDTYWNFIFPVPIQETRWVKAVEIRPGDKRYVHHANILVDRAGSSAQARNRAGRGFRRHGDSHRVAGLRSRQPSCSSGSPARFLTSSRKAWRFASTKAPT